MKGSLGTAAVVMLVAAGALFEAYEMGHAPVAYGEHPARWVGTWVGPDGAGGTLTLALDASGRYTERRAPSRRDDRRGHWGVFPSAADPRRTRLCVREPDGSDERCTDAPSDPAAGLASPRLGVVLRRVAR